jgi:Protein of unknown function (DUF3631)/Domain of unknown function (DUF3854)
MKLAQAYLRDRGIKDETVKIHGLELDARASDKTVKDRLGRSLAKSGVNEIIWIPIYDAQGNGVSWIARPLPNIFGLPKYICPLGSDGTPYVPHGVYQLPYGKPVIITEAPIKALAIAQAGFDVIGLNGVWCAGIKDANELVRIRADLQRILDWRGRKVYLGFDADWTINPLIRQAQIRLFFLLSYSGADVFQLTSWDVSQGKGIDDHLMWELQSNGQHNPAQVLSALVASAKPFIETLTPTPLDLGLVVAELKKVHLSKNLRAQLVRKLAPVLGVPVNELERSEKEDSKKGVILPDPEPWPDPVNIAQLVDEITAILGRHIWMNDHCQLAAALWLMMAWGTDAFDVLPLLTISSPVKRCGKTKLLTVLKRMARKAVSTSNISAAALYRVVEKYAPTLIIDEFDSFGKDNEDLRNVINSGHTRDSTDCAWRCAPDTHEPEPFNTCCPKAIGLIGKLHPTTHDRSIVIRLERKPTTIKVEPLRNTTPAQYDEVRCKAIRCLFDHKDQLRAANPAALGLLHDRANDNWSPLLAIAEVGGKELTDKTLAAIKAIDPGEDDDDSPTIAVLLALRTVFKEAWAEYKKGHLIPGKEAEFSMISGEIVKELNGEGYKDAPWADWNNGGGITEAKLARILKEFNGRDGKPIRPIQRMVSGIRGKRYFLGDLQLVFDAYLPSAP